MQKEEVPSRVEFLFTLPQSQLFSTSSDFNLPSSSQQFLELLKSQSKSKSKPQDNVQQSAPIQAQITPMQGKEKQKEQSTSELPEFAVVDDSLLGLRSWGRHSKGKAIIHRFQSLEAFWQGVEDSAGLLKRLEFVVTDFHFGDQSANNGFEFASKLRLQFSRPIFLSSDGEFQDTQFKDAEFKDSFTGIISKIPKSYDEMKNLAQLLTSKPTQGPA